MDRCLQLGEGILSYERAVGCPVFRTRPPLQALSVRALVIWPPASDLQSGDAGPAWRVSCSDYNHR